MKNHYYLKQGLNLTRIMQGEKNCMKKFPKKLILNSQKTPGSGSGFGSAIMKNAGS
jgi:hypothetical protein